MGDETSVVRVGVLGCGRIGSMHAEMLAGRVPGAALAGVYDVVGDAATAVGTSLGVPVHDSVESLLAGGCDAVAICSSVDSHIELIVAAAEAGLATFCEKPLSLDLDDIDRGLAAVDAAGTMLQIGFNRRFDPSHAAVRQAVVDGDVGQLELLRITSRDPAPPPMAYLETAGGLFNDMMIHDFDMARFVAGSEVVEVYATGAVRVDPAIGEIGDIDTAVVVLTHESGCITTIDNCRRTAYGYDQRVEAFGSGGVAASDNPPVHSTWQRGPDGRRSAPIGHFFIERYTDAYLRQWAAFVEAVRTSGPSPVTGADGRAPVVLAAAAKRSLDTARPVRI